MTLRIGLEDRKLEREQGEFIHVTQPGWARLTLTTCIWVFTLSAGLSASDVIIRTILMRRVQS